MKGYLPSHKIEELEEVRHQHQFNDNAVRHTRTLGTRVGLERIGVHLIRLESGRDSTQFHYHDNDEEFLFIISGRGIADIGGETFEVGPGDFMGFPAPSPPHSLHNPHEKDLVYLMGGERKSADVVHYPRIGRSMIKSFGRKRWVDWKDLHELP
ncbi:MAG: cupin domain-containing protein [Gammaproteobacteria bacterium]|nr:cupin domain-containing protein [Gammaproteobacteria bacterium]